VRFRYVRPFTSDGALPPAGTLRDGLMLLGVEPGLARLRAEQRELEDALVPIMTGLVRATGLMDSASGLESIPVRRA
jgi:hypothetical protein